MSFKRKGQLAPSREWLKHFGKQLRRFFWKRERSAEKKQIAEELETDHKVGDDLRP
jgi:hypothetical protein